MDKKYGTTLVARMQWLEEDYPALRSASENGTSTWLECDQDAGDVLCASPLISSPPSRFSLRLLLDQQYRVMLRYNRPSVSRYVALYPIGMCPASGGTPC